MSNRPGKDIIEGEFKAANENKSKGGQQSSVNPKGAPRGNMYRFSALFKRLFAHSPLNDV
jgi:hypothetical protein